MTIFLVVFTVIVLIGGILLVICGSMTSVDSESAVGVRQAGVGAAVGGLVLVLLSSWYLIPKLINSF